MPHFKRSRHAGGTFFFTLVTNNRRPLLASSQAINALRSAFCQVQREQPFTIPAIVILPDHLHLLMALPQGDDDYSLRIGRIKVLFTKSLPADAEARRPTTASRARHRESGVWQRRFWEHTIRDETDFIRHVDYVHFNPVRHGLATCPHQWPWSSFSRLVRRGECEPDWGCSCNGRLPERPADEDDLAKRCGE